MAKNTSVERGGKSIQVKVRNINRTMTGATLVATLPRGSRILGFTLSGVASNAGTTAVLSIGKTTTSNEFVATVNVLAAGQGNGVQPLVGVAGAVGGVASKTSPVPIYVLYAETGTASTLGGWTLQIEYTTGNAENDDTV